MRALIIPDLHHHIENAEHWLKTQCYDRVIFLGDYFDDFDDDANDARKTARWLREKMDSTDATRHIFLLGNHDAAYLFPDHDELSCPGFTKAKSNTIREILRAEHWHRFELAHEEQGWLLSHAGFHLVWMEKPTVRRILQRCEKAMKLVRRGKVDPILGYGEKPGGLQRIGGPLWMAWENFMPIPGINQIVGHSPDSLVREQCGMNSRNLCLDVKNGCAAALLSGGDIKVLLK